MPHFDADQSSVLSITVIFGPARLIVAAFCRSSANVSVGSKSDLTSLESDVCIGPKSRHHRSSFIFQTERIPLAIYHLAVLCDRHTGAALGVDELSWRSGSEPSQK
jgi:hypothetical protein